VPNASGSVDLSSLSTDEKDAVERLAAERGDPPPTEEEAPEKILTAFLVLVDMNFNPQVMAVQDPRFEVSTPPTPDLVYATAAVIMKDKAAQESAMATAEIMQAQAQAMMQQQQEAMIRSRLANEGGLQGIRG
jgi:hypothetical protein